MANYDWRELGWIPDRLNSESLPRKIFSERETPTSRYLVSLRRASSIRPNARRGKLGLCDVSLDPCKLSVRGEATQN